MMPPDDQFDVFWLSFSQQMPSKFVRPDPTKPIYIYGCGSFGIDVAHALLAKNYQVAGFIDKAATDAASGHMGLPVLALQAAQKIASTSNAQVLVGIFNRSSPYADIDQTLSDIGFEMRLYPWDFYEVLKSLLGWRYWLESYSYLRSYQTELAQIYTQLADTTSRQTLLSLIAFRSGLNLGYSKLQHPDNQYFNDLSLAPFMSSNKIIAYVDGGAYTGDTYLELQANTDIRLTEAYLFEPDPNNYAALIKNTSLNHLNHVRLTRLPLGLSNRYETVAFSGSGEGTTLAVQDMGTNHLAVVALDDLCAPNDIPFNFIKLDVEGAEELALEGMRGTIKQLQKPSVLTISLYHKPDDLWRIPAQLMAIRSDWQFYIRQHYFNSFDLVLYAVLNISHG